MSEELQRVAVADKPQRKRKKKRSVVVGEALQHVAAAKERLRTRRSVTSALHK